MERVASTTGGLVVDIMVGGGHPMLSSLLAEVLGERGYRAVAAGSGEQLLAEVRRSPPDVCLVHDVRDANEMDFVRALSDAGLGRCRVVLVSQNDQYDVDLALDNGATGLVSQGCDVDALVAVIDGVMCGQRMIRRSVCTQPRPRDGATNPTRLAARLTARERECLALLVDGLGTAEMAERLNVSTMTVRSHIRSVLTKLGVHSRLEAASFAVRWGLLAMNHAQVRSRKARAS